MSLLTKIKENIKSNLAKTKQVAKVPQAIGRTVGQISVTPIKMLGGFAKQGLESAKEQTEPYRQIISRIGAKQKPLEAIQAERQTLQAKTKLQDVLKGREIKKQQPQISVLKSREIAEQQRKRTQTQEMALASEMTGGLKQIGKASGFVPIKKVLDSFKVPETEKIGMEIKKPLAGLKPKAFKVAKQAKEFISKTAEEIRPELEQIKGKTLTHQEVLKSAGYSNVLRKVTTREQTLVREATILRTKQHLASLAEGKGISPEFIGTMRKLSLEATSLGRQLESLKIEAVPSEYGTKSKMVRDIMDAGISAKKIEQAAKGVDFNNAKEVTKFYRQFIKPKFTEIIDEYRYINLLSSPRTHIINAFSNLLQGSVLAPTTKLITGIIDPIESALTGKARRAYVGEVPAYYKGFLGSIPNAVKETLNVLRGKSGVYKPELSRIPTNVPILKQLQIIPRFLEAGDILFRTLVSGGEKASLKWRTTQKGAKLSDAAINQLADEHSSYYIFRKALDPQNVTGQGKILSVIDRVTSGVTRLRKTPVVGWFAPFVETPMNILKQGIEYSPLGISTLPGATNKSEQIAKTLIGSSIFMGAGSLALQGKTTWSAPTSEKEKNAFYAAGRQPYSIQIGDKWISYSKLGPVAYPLALASAVAWYAKENPKSVTEDNLQKIANILSGTAKFFSDQSYVQGMGSLLDTLGGDTYAIGKAAANLPTQLIPLVSLQRWVAQMIDPIYRKAKTGLSFKSIGQNIIKGIPFASKTLEPYETPIGEPSKRQFPFLNAINPLNITKKLPQAEEFLQSLRQGKREELLKTESSEELKKQAQDIWTQIKQAKTGDEAKIILQPVSGNEELRKQIREVAKQETTGSVQNYDIEAVKARKTNKEKAQVIVDKLKSFQTGQEAQEFINNLKQAGILTDDVKKQMKEVLQQSQ